MPGESNWPFWLVASFIILGMLGCAAALVYEARERDRFMTECEQYQHRYECVALWSQSHPPAPPTTVHTWGHK